jgi:uncharacterized protein
MPQYFMSLIKMPQMEKSEYDALIGEEYICRIAFSGGRYPHIAPFLYVFDGKFMYFLSTKYGRKIEHFRKNPNATVEVERYSPDLSHFAFVMIPGILDEVRDPDIKRTIRQLFIDLIRTRGLSPHVLSALGHSPDEPLDVLLSEEHNSVWRLTGVKVREIIGLRNSKKSRDIEDGDGIS